MNIKFTVTILIFAFVALLVVTSCHPTTPNKEFIYSEAEDFYLGDDICKEFGYDSILISKGDYPISFDKNENGDITLKVLKKFGNGNGVNSVKSMVGGHRCREWIRDGRYHCGGWGFNKCCSLYTRTTKEVKYTIVLTNDDLLSIEILDKVPFGEEGYELN